MYAIKRIFYLSFNDKVLFFKTFLLPYFDYCFSIIIYFSKTVINNLAKIYYLRLYKLFNFNFNNSNTHQINSRLNTFSLSSFEYRCTYKFFDFSYKIKHNRLAPKELSARICVIMQLWFTQYDTASSSLWHRLQHRFLIGLIDNTSSFYQKKIFMAIFKSVVTQFLSLLPQTLLYNLCSADS